jgi:hypothetical protein
MKKTAKNKSKLNKKRYGKRINEGATELPICNTT